LLTDTHCHLNLNLYQTDLKEVLERAWERGVQRILLPGIDLETSQLAIELSECHPGLFAAVGIHPNDALKWTEDTTDQLKDMIKHPRVVAIGEIGLDYYRQHAPHPLQQEILRLQLQLATENDLPVILHSRQAMQDLWPILEQWQADLQRRASPLALRPGVFHSYEGDAPTARHILDRNFLIGVSGPVTFKNAVERQQLFSTLALQGLVLETDSPYLTPHPYRGQRNEPGYVYEIAQKLAELHNTSLAEIAAHTTANANRLFLWEKSV